MGRDSGQVAMRGVEVIDAGDEIVILGMPQDEPSEWDDDDPRRHNCDAMGCGSLGNHVIYRWRKGVSDELERL